MPTQQQRRSDEDAVRSVFREHGTFPRRWTIPDEDLEAYLNAEYDVSDDNDSDESIEGYETGPLLAAGDRATLAPSYNGNTWQIVVERWHLILEPRQKRRSNPVGLRCVGLSCVILGLILLGLVYLRSSVLKAMLFPEEKNATAPVQGLT